MKIVATRKERGTDKIGAAKAVITRRLKGNLGSGSAGGRKGYETRVKNGTYSPAPKESYERGILTKRTKGIDITAQLNKPEVREKAKAKCNDLANRPLVAELRELAIKSRKKLGSGWVRKPDSWILAQIAQLSA